MARCAVNRTPYTVFGHGGKQVRDNIHSLDLVRAFWSFFQSPGSGEVYNIGGGRASNCSIIEAMEVCERLTGQPFDAQFGGSERKGDHVWWISDARKFRAAHPDWMPEYGIERLMSELLEGAKQSANIE
jgi:CDP-paratose 2-epimerase